MPDIENTFEWQVPTQYYPDRFEHFLGSVLSSLLVGRAEKDRESCIRTAFLLAEKIEVMLNERDHQTR